jgi:UDP-glucose:(heptosyl)LPS alpha-1,3-glucosyltransferase
MRVAIVQEHIDPRRGGAETSTLQMARHLAGLGLDVTVVCSTPAPVHGERQASPDVPPGGNQSAARPTIHQIPESGASRVARTVRFVGDADRLCRLEGFDIVHAVTPCLSATVYQPRGGTYVETVARSVARARTSVGRLIKRIARRFNRRQRLLLLLERELLRGQDPPVVVAVSDYVRRQVEAAFPRFPHERMRVVFNGVEIAPLPSDEAAARRAALRRELGGAQGRPLVLFVAHNFKLKGLGELIRASATPAGRQVDWLLVVAGRDDPRRHARQARRLGLDQRVKFVGTEYHVAALYAAAGVLAHPTWYDPCSRVVLEALACGLPVVTTRWNGAAEVMQPGRHGEVIDTPADAPALAAAIARCFDLELACACRADAPTMRARVSMARHARELKMVYEQVAGQ